MALLGAPALVADRVRGLVEERLEPVVRAHVARDADDVRLFARPVLDDAARRAAAREDHARRRKAVRLRERVVARLQVALARAHLVGRRARRLRRGRAGRESRSGRRPSAGLHVTLPTSRRDGERGICAARGRQPRRRRPRRGARGAGPGGRARRRARPPSRPRRRRARRLRERSSRSRARATRGRGRARRRRGTRGRAPRTGGPSKRAPNARRAAAIGIAPSAATAGAARPGGSFVAQPAVEAAAHDALEDEGAGDRERHEPREPRGVDVARERGVVQESCGGKVRQGREREDRSGRERGSAVILGAPRTNGSRI